MDEKIINQPCIRVTIIIDNVLKSHGSGTLIKGADGFFVVTAYHCIYGDKDQFAGIETGQIVIESQDSYNAPFESIQVTEILDHNGSEDWVLLKVAYDDTKNEFPGILTTDSFKTDMPVTFTGFQEVERDQCRTFKCRVLNGISNNEFRITLSGQDRFKGGADDARGLSGSGAFIINENKLYLIGILKSVRGEDATNNDIKCCPVTSCAKMIGLENYDIATQTFGDNWGSEQFGELILTDVRGLEDKIQAVNDTMSEHKLKKLCRDLALGKSELAGILERDLSAIKYRVFEACQGELIDFVDQNKKQKLSVEEITELLEKYKAKAIEIIKVKSQKYKYPNLDDDLMYKIVLDLINDCYLSFDEKGIYAE